MTCDQQRSHQILPLNSADSATLRSDSGARMQAFFSARSLIEWANRVLATAAPIQMVMGCIHRVNNLNYPLTVIGHVETGLQFRYIPVGVSNKEDEIMYTIFLKHIMFGVLNPITANPYKLLFGLHFRTLSSGVVFFILFKIITEKETLVNHHGS